MKAIKGMSIAGTLVLVLGACAMPQEEEYVGFEELDADNDGFLTVTEAESGEDLLENWDAIDVDGDDRVSEAEFAAFEGPPGD